MSKKAKYISSAVTFSIALLFIFLAFTLPLNGEYNAIGVLRDLYEQYAGVGIIHENVGLLSSAILTTVFYFLYIKFNKGTFMVFHVLTAAVFAFCMVALSCTIYSVYGFSRYSLDIELNPIFYIFMILAFLLLLLGYYIYYCFLRAIAKPPIQQKFSAKIKTFLLEIALLPIFAFDNMLCLGLTPLTLFSAPLCDTTGFISRKLLCYLKDEDDYDYKTVFAWASLIIFPLRLVTVLASFVAIFSNAPVVSIKRFNTKEEYGKYAFLVLDIIRFKKPMLGSKGAVQK